MSTVTNSSVFSGSVTCAGMPMLFRTLARSVLSGTVDVFGTHTLGNASSPGMLVLHLLTGRPVPRRVLSGMTLEGQTIAAEVMQEHIRVGSASTSDTDANSESNTDKDTDRDLELLTDVALHLSNGVGFLRILSLDAPRVACILADIGRAHRDVRQDATASPAMGDTMEGSLLLIHMSRPICGPQRAAKWKSLVPVYTRGHSIA